jgi:tripartite-type tricarboxylate transporter receptor subunit TctC
VVPLGPGSATDVLARLLAEFMHKDLGATVVVENRAGAGGAVGADYVSKAAPDGYVLGVFHSSVLSASAAINPKLPYDPVHGFTYLGNAASNPIVLVVPTNSRFKTLDQYLDEAKSKPESVTAGFIGVGSHSQFNIALVNSLSGAKVSAIPYAEGTGPLVTGLLGGQIDSASILWAAVAGQVQGGKLRLLATAAPLPDHPEAPTFASQGLKRADMQVYSVFMAPPGLPDAIAERLTASLKRAVADKEVAKKITDLGFIVQYTPPAEVRERMRNETRLLTDVAKQAGINGSW